MAGRNRSFELGAVGLIGDASTTYFSGFLGRSIPEMLDWVFVELLAGRTPEFDYDRLNNRGGDSTLKLFSDLDPD